MCVKGCNIVFPTEDIIWFSKDNQWNQEKKIPKKNDVEWLETLGFFRVINPNMINLFASQSLLRFLVMVFITFLQCSLHVLFGGTHEVIKYFVSVSSTMSTVKSDATFLAVCWYSWFGCISTIVKQKLKRSRSDSRRFQFMVGWLESQRWLQ